ncbi:hypothetical protein [Pelagimonas varians]|uniref:Uncharacterized protein n=1 Tax=Pelagimonas varians TaxID=696760 RepID=A0A238L5J5_9RHOB|nr:hypothetical protein [Pelagimonas varians]PYG25496.1 hypothetical protein C8N36_13225 [Pelagimonas varians]SMX50355.1 hypothetical protein PEV8663_04612 [Pelagimonas varians]
MSEREPLAMPNFDTDLDDFSPRTPGPAGQGAPVSKPIPRAAETRKAVDAVSLFPSREASTDGQLNLKGPQHVLDRFKAMCKADRRPYYDMLEILMDGHDRSKM